MEEKSRTRDLAARLAPYAPLLFFGFASELVYGLYFLRGFPLTTVGPVLTNIAFLTATSTDGFINFVGALVALYFSFAVAWWWTRRREDRTGLWLILGFGAVFALTLTFTFPLTSNDVFDYVAESIELVQHHANPILVPVATFRHDPLMNLAGMWAPTKSPYGPIGVVVDALPTYVAGRNVVLNVALIKLQFSLLLLFDSLVVYGILRRRAPRAALSGALLVAWNPFLLIEFAANGHNDIVMMTFVLLALFCLAEGQLTAGPLLLTGSILVKYVTIPLLPLFLMYGAARQPTWRARGWYLLSTTVAVLAVGAIVSRAFDVGTDTIRATLSQPVTYFTSGPSVVQRLWPSLDPDTIASAGKLLFGIVYLYSLRLAAESRIGVLRGCLLTMTALVALVANNIWFWYAAWAVLLAAPIPALSERLAGVWLGVASEISAGLFYFVWPWLGAQTFGITLVGRIAYLLLFVPFAALLVAEPYLPGSFRRRPLLDSAAAPVTSSEPSL
jgi:hypothetical protein